jgi:FeS assembly SUF system protein
MSDNESTTAEKIMGNVLNLSDEASPHEPSTPLASGDAGNIRDEILKEEIIETIRTIFDPEIPVNIYELGLIYDLAVENGNVWVKMTLTSPACPVAGTLPGEVEAKIATVPGVENVELELVWEPSYNMEMMSEAARLQLGLLW